MRHLIWLVLLTGLAHAAPAVTSAAPTPLQFVDEWTAQGLPLYGQQSVALGAPQQAGGETQSAATFTLVGEQGAAISLRVLLADGPQGQRLLVDANGTGTPDVTATPATPETRPPGFGDAVQPVWLAELQQPAKRTAAFRLSTIPGMIVMALRGHATAAIATGKGPVSLYAQDTNANAVLDEDTDALYVDLNRDGKLNGPGERLMAAAALDVADRIVQPTIGAAFGALAVAVEPAVDVPVRFAIAALKTPPVKLLASIQRQGGGALLLKSLAQPVKLRVGNYSLESLSVGVRGARGGPNMYYNFERTGTGATLPVRAGGAGALELVGKITLVPSWSLSGPDGAPVKTAAPGAELSCTVDAVTATGMKLVGCNTSNPEENYPTKVPPRLALVDPSGKVIFSGAMTFG